MFPCQIHDLDHPVSYQDKIQQNMVAEYIDLKNAVRVHVHKHRQPKTNSICYYYYI